MHPLHRAVLKLLIGSEAMKVQDILEELTAFEISEEEARPFLEFHDYLTNPQPPFISRWRNATKLEKRYHRFVDGVLGNTRQSFTATRYHHSRIIDIEKKLFEGLANVDFKKIAPE